MRTGNTKAAYNVSQTSDHLQKVLFVRHDFTGIDIWSDCIAVSFRPSVTGTGQLISLVKNTFPMKLQTLLEHTFRTITLERPHHCPENGFLKCQVGSLATLHTSPSGFHLMTLFCEYLMLLIVISKSLKLLSFTVHHIMETLDLSFIIKKICSCGVCMKSGCIWCFYMLFNLNYFAIN